jgi:pentatricopeptide repeat protein
LPSVVVKGKKCSFGGGNVIILSITLLVICFANRIGFDMADEKKLMFLSRLGRPTLHPLRYLLRYQHSWKELVHACELQIPVSQEKVTDVVEEIMQGMGPASTISDSIEVLLQYLTLENAKWMDSVVLSYLKHVRQIPLEQAKAIIHLYIQKDQMPSARVKNVLLFGVARNKDVGKIRQWIDFMANQKFLLEGLTDSLKYNALAVASRNSVTDSLTLFDTVQQLNDISEQTYTTILRNLIGNPDLYNNVMKRYEESHLPQHPVFRIVHIQYLFLQGNVDEGLQKIDELVSTGIPITTFMANIILQGLFENSKVDEAIQFFNNFSMLGVRPDSYTFGILIHQLTCLGMYQAAIGFHRQLQQFKIMMTLKLWSIVINLYASCGDISACEALFEELKQSRTIEPNTYIYCIMMRASADAKHFQRVLDLYQEMKDAGLPDTELARRYVVVACANIPQLRAKVMETYQITFSAALKQYQETGVPTQELMVLLTNEGLYLRLFGAFIEDSSVCFQLYKDMWKLGLDPSYGINFLIVAHDINRNTPMVYRWGRRLLDKDRHKFSNASYRAYLLACIKRKRFEQSISVIAKSRSLGQIPPLRFQNVLLEHFIDNRDKFELLLNCFGDGDRNTDRFRILISFYGRHGLIDTAWRVWLEYLDYLEYSQKSRPNLAVLRAICKACQSVLQYSNSLERIISNYGLDKEKLIT